MSNRGRPFSTGREAGRLLWRQPLAPLLLGLLLLAWELTLSACTRPLLLRILDRALAGDPVLPTGVGLFAISLAFSALLTPLVGLGLALVESGAGGALPRTVANLAGLGTIGLCSSLAGAASQACLVAATLAVARRRLAGGAAVSCALLFALPSAPAMLLGALAAGALLLGAARIAAGELSAPTPAAGLRVLGLCSVDLLEQPRRAGAAVSAALILTLPFTLGATFLGLSGAVMQRSLARGALYVGAALAAAAALLWVALGLRLALLRDTEAARLPDGPVIQ
jgi:hypothetical protein